MNIEQTAENYDRDCDRVTAEMARFAPERISSAQAWINTIQLYRFPLGLAVVAVHSGEFVATLSRAKLSAGGGSNFGLWLVDFITLVARIATPSFLLIAGFVFFRDGKVSFDQYRRKVKSRFFTLLVPYVAWNFLTVLLLCAPSALKYFFFAPGTYADTPLTFNGLVKWAVGWPIYPADGPLWFVRDLLLLIALAPLLSLIPRRVQMAGLGTLFIYWLLGPTDMIPGGIPRAASVLFFMIGAWMGLNQTVPRASPMVNRITVLAAAVLLFSAAGGAACSALGGEHFEARSLFERMVRISGASLIICAGTRSPFPAWLSGPLLRLSPIAFFLFASHYLVYLCVTPLFAEFSRWQLGRGHEILLFGLVFSTIIAVSLTSYLLLKHAAPSFLGMLDGNRSMRISEIHTGGRKVEVVPLQRGAPEAAPFHTAVRGG